ncbi:MFS transporter [Paenibacillus sp. CF384]|uniref:MFS transporter n=1 Tax=Paenibacillus sp. CF384 TaxID=1884382 RepID=UPI0008950984|nr:MFS transporter [Paenibacillus sp. CF384]SDX50178.1 MFS transporter, DHA2 family, metal-tetracycline-proton antiporter [Paenibacillus sp. CF384]
MSKSITGNLPLEQLSATTEKKTLSNEHYVTFMLGFTVVLVIMNTMMFNLALPKVAEQFSLATSTASWIVTGYSIVFAISSITYSRLSDILPIRALFIAALLSIGGGSLLGLFSDGFGMLLVARLIQASGAGAIPSLGIVLLTRYIPLTRRGRAMSIMLAATSLGLGLGPVIGGSVVQYLGWHFLFVITGVTLLLIPIFLRMLPAEKAAGGSFDVLGALLIGIGTTSLLLFLTSKSLLALGVGILAILLFVWRIRTAKNPFVLPVLFSNKSYLALASVAIAAYMVSFSFLFLAPQMLSHLYGLTPGASGLVLFPGALLAMLVSNRVGRIIDRYGNASLIRYVPWMLLLSVILLALFATHSYYALGAIFILTSISFTAISSSVSNEMSRLLPKELVGSGMGLFQLMQFISGGFSVALSASALAWQRDLPQVRAFDNLIWGMVVVALLSIASAVVYRWYKKRTTMTEMNTGN